ncbi:copper amine oxidase N-terminal domain-containing protein [Paenibacillaceae bacterium]|nr:copper amine oxidase N-terminal domain-containing protein [Paenibacillaceae bacterium]
MSAKTFTQGGLIKLMTIRQQSTSVSRIVMTLLALFGFAVALTAFSSGASAASTIEVNLDEKKINFDKDPVSAHGTTLVQFRPLFEAMGIKVTWNSKQQTITGTKDNFSLVMTINSKQATVNGKVIQLAQPPQIMNGNTMVPIRFISEATGALVAWEPYKPQILIYTESFLQELGVTKAQAQEAINKELARIKAEYEADQAANPPVKPVPVPNAPKGSGEYKPAVSDAVDLNKLQGMYYGFREDHGGYECGGICWDMYTFLPGNKVLVGQPANGGPETIDCKKDACTSYTIKNSKLTLGNGKSYSIGKKNGGLVIDDVELTRVKPSTANLKLSKKYIYRGYQGLIGISSGATSWSKTIAFHANGTFESDSLMIGSVEGGSSRTQGGTGKSTSGSYRVSGNTLVLAFGDGTIENHLFFIHEDTKRGELGDIHIGKNNYYVD